MTPSHHHHRVREIPRYSAHLLSCRAGRVAGAQHGTEPRPIANVIARLSLRRCASPAKSAKPSLASSQPRCFSGVATDLPAGMLRPCWRRYQTVDVPTPRHGNTRADVGVTATRRLRIVPSSALYARVSRALSKPAVSSREVPEARPPHVEEDSRVRFVKSDVWLDGLHGQNCLSGIKAQEWLSPSRR